MATMILIYLLVIRYYYQYQQETFLGTILSLFGPCLVVNDFSFYYLINGILSTVGNMCALIFLAILVRYDSTPMSTKEKFPKAFADMNFDNGNLSNKEFHDLMQNHQFFNSTSILFIFVVLSIGSIILLHYYLDPVKRYRISLWISNLFGLLLMFISLTVHCVFFMFIIFPLCLLNKCFSDRIKFLSYNSVRNQFMQTCDWSMSLKDNDWLVIWRSEENLWLPKINQLLNIRPEATEKFQYLDQQVKEEMGETLLEFSIRSGKFHLAKVSFKSVHSILVYRTQVLTPYKFVILNLTLPFSL